MGHSYTSKPLAFSIALPATGLAKGMLINAASSYLRHPRPGWSVQAYTLAPYQSNLATLSSLPASLFWPDFLLGQEVPRRMVGLLNKVQLCLFSRLNKERCIAIYLFVQWVIRMRRKGGWLNLGLYSRAS